MTATTTYRRVDLAPLFPDVPQIEGSPYRFIELPVRENLTDQIPVRMPGFVQELSFVEEFASFMVEGDFMVTLTGPTGCGKTERCLDFLARVRSPGYHFAAVGHHRLFDVVADRTVEDGKIKVLPKPLLKAMQQGVPIIVDEIFRWSPTITSALHLIRDRGELYVDDLGRTVSSAPGFKLVATANQAGLGDTTGFYAGDETQDVAWLNGSPTIECDYPRREVEEKIVADLMVSLDPIFSTSEFQRYPRDFVDVANGLRKLFVGAENTATDNRIELPFSTRQLVKWVRYWYRWQSLTGVPSVYRAMDFVFSRRLCRKSREAVDALIATHFNVKRAD